ncbi:hypothetical protein, partial [Rhizobium johnstonii]|uniref:hypothetical protein n=1 Tax=Rhizobium johnstonii TaxID=3019933 RepID=UPI003F95E980
MNAWKGECEASTHPHTASIFGGIDDCASLLKHVLQIDDVPSIQFIETSSICKDFGPFNCKI